MGLLIAIIVLIIVIGVIALAVLKRRPVSPMPTASDVAPPAAAPNRPDIEMTGLESALAEVTDSSGTPIADRIDAEGDHVDELRVPDDTGPLLRRALDHVQPADEATDGDETDAVDGVD